MKHIKPNKRGLFPIHLPRGEEMMLHLGNQHYLNVLLHEGEDGGLLIGTRTPVGSAMTHYHLPPPYEAVMQTCGGLAMPMQDARNMADFLFDQMTPSWEERYHRQRVGHYHGETCAEGGPRDVDLGTVSRATMITGDLICSFMTVLEKWALDLYHHAEARLGEIKDICLSNHGEVDEDYDAQLEDFLHEGLFDALNSIAPPFCYFGAHEGDGSDYGFWVSNEALDEAIDNATVLEVNDSKQWSHEHAYSVIKTETGHIKTLLDKFGEEVWSNPE